MLSCVQHEGLIYKPITCVKPKQIKCQQHINASVLGELGQDREVL